MQYDPTKVDFTYQSNTYANQYPLIYQTPSPQPLIDSTNYVIPNVQYHGYSQQNVVILSTSHSFWSNQIVTTITPNLKVFFMLSSMIYLIWSVSSFILEIILLVQSNSTFYRGIWVGAFLLSGSICMLILAGRLSYPLINLLTLFTLILFFCILGLILSAVNYSMSKRCSSKFSMKHSCDQELISILKITILIIMIMATIHTLINIIVIYKEYRKTSIT